MSPIVYIIDPDVWKLSLLEPRCHVAVQDFWERLKNHGNCLGLDYDQVEREYEELLLSSDLPDDLRKILQEIFNIRERSDKIRTLKPNTSPELDATLQRLKCNTPVEPALIRMAATVDDASTQLILVGADSLLRQRGLHQKEGITELRRYFRQKRWTSVQVIWTTQIGLPGRNEQELGYQRRVFEDQVRSLLVDRILQTIGSRPQSEKPTPSQAEKHKDSAGKEAGEIDVYLYLDLPDARHVWICECELREAGNEGQPTTTDKVLKLRRKVEAVRAFEKSQGKTAVVKGYMITNAHEPSAQANAIMGDCEFQFCSVSMPKKWATDYRWCLRPDDIKQLEL